MRPSLPPSLFFGGGEQGPTPASQPYQLATGSAGFVVTPVPKELFLPCESGKEESVDVPRCVSVGAAVQQPRCSSERLISGASEIGGQAGGGWRGGC